MLPLSTLGKVILPQVTELSKSLNVIIGVLEFEMAKLGFRSWQHYASSHIIF